MEDLDWGQDKKNYYMRDEESDYIEEDEEANELQNQRLKKIIDANLLQDSEEDEAIDQIEDQRASIDLDLSDSEKSDGKLILSKEVRLDLEEKAKELKDYLNIIKSQYNPLIDIFTEQAIDTPETIKFLKFNRKLILSYCSCIIYYIVNLSLKKINLHHPVVKKIHLLKSLIDKHNDDDLIPPINKLIETLEHMSNEDKVERINVKPNNQTLLGKKREKEDKERIRKEKIWKTIEFKNNEAIKKANKLVETAKGITRKRKRKQGNAKLMNKIKYQKKEKIRKNMVKKYEGKPLVYTGEATGIRRDLSRSVKLK